MLAINMIPAACDYPTFNAIGYTGDGTRSSHAYAAYDRVHHDTITRFLRRHGQTIATNQDAREPLVFRHSRDDFAPTLYRFRHSTPNFVPILLGQISAPPSLANELVIDHRHQDNPVHMGSTVYHHRFGYGAIQGGIALTSTHVQLLIAFRTMYNFGDIRWVAIWARRSIVYLSVDASVYFQNVMDPEYEATIEAVELDRDISYERVS